MYSSVTHHLYTVLCVYHPKSSLLPSTFTPPLPSSTFPHPTPFPFLNFLTPQRQAAASRVGVAGLNAPGPFLSALVQVCVCVPKEERIPLCMQSLLLSIES